MEDYEDLEPVRLFLFKLIKEKSRFIGSRAWGVGHNDSDYDYLISFDNLNSILDIAANRYPEAWRTKRVYQESHGDSCDIDKLREFYSIIILVGDKKINVISPKGKANYRAWKQASRLFSKFIGEDFIKEKYARVKLFECFKDIFRSKYLKVKKENPKRKQQDDIPF